MKYKKPEEKFGKKDMKKVMVDSNVLFSGLLFKGKPNKILKLVEKHKIKIIIPQDELDELYRVFQRKVSYKVYVLDLFIKMIKPKIVSYREYSKFIPEASKLIKDKKDAPILACALSIKPDYFITGDKDFYVENIKQKINVILPTMFLKEINRWALGQK